MTTNSTGNRRLGNQPTGYRVPLLIGLGLAALGSSGQAAATPRETRCLRGDAAVCQDHELADPARYRQVILLPGGYATADKDQFFSDAERFVASVSQAPLPTYTAQRAHQILYVSVWVPGSELDSPQSQFGAKVMKHPVRGKALSLDLAAVQAELDSQADLHPWAAMVIFNTMEDGITANASPPGFLDKPYGIGKVTRLDLNSHYVPAHELAHAGLNFVDEYIENGLGSISIKLMDILTPSAILHSGWGSFWQSVQNFFGIYSYRISEILAANGSDNVDVSRHPSRVETNGYVPKPYDLEGGMFFGKGTFHHRGKNLMGGFSGTSDPEDGFGFDHSAPQVGVIQSAFDGAPPPRPNDRLRAVGPYNGYAAVTGRTAKVVLYDGDKNHHFHPTTQYTVQLGWFHHYWGKCGTQIKIPCLKKEWQTLESNILPVKRTLELKSSALYGLAGLVQKVICQLGVGKPKPGGSSLDLCSQSVDQMANAFLPTLVFTLPYQEVELPVRDSFTTYFWRFKSVNSARESGFTAWSKFTRTF